ncbi:MAG: Gfo/Idh/MocA family oxidoreductase [Petrimonas sp.]|nr:Gfo/Idh/MocA family oxidoreductase [Petrimonas sp.]
MKIITKTLLIISALALTFLAPAQQKPVRIGVAGLTHDHIHGLLGRKAKGDIVIVGIAEPNQALVEKYANLYHIDKKLFFPTLDEMLRKTKPEAVMAYNDIFGHLEVVEKCAPRGIHVMVEKPLAVSTEHAEKMAVLAKKYQIQLLTNYETTWYGSNAVAYKMADEENAIGQIRKIEFHTGHQGPVEIGCSKEFLAWLTDPVLNGAGALKDFGCYGANIATWLMKGKTPVSVTAVTHTNKPQVYPKVDDEATIVLQYPEAQVVIQASWNWPYNRKDMELYGQSGYVFCKNATDMAILKTGEKQPQDYTAPVLPDSRNDAFSYLAGVVRGSINPAPSDLSALPNNITVVKILEAAKISAKTGKTVFW